MTKEMYLALVVVWDATLALHKYTWRWLCDVVNWIKKDNELSMNSYMLYDALLCL